jgi:integrase
MAMTLSTPLLMGQLVTLGATVCRAQRRDETERLLDMIMAYQAEGRLALKSDQVDTLVSAYRDARKAAGQSYRLADCRQRVTEVLQALNELPYCHNVLPTTPQPLHRPTAMPQRGEQLQDIEEAKSIRASLLQWCRESEHPDGWLLTLALSLAARLGMGERVIVSTLAMLRYEMVARDSWLSIPTQPIELPQVGRYALQVPHDVWEALRAIRTRAPSQDSDTLLVFSAREAEKPLHKRESAVRQRLNKAYEAYQKASRREGSLLMPRHCMSWYALARAARYLPVFAKVPPLWATLLARYPLPTSTTRTLLGSSRWEDEPDTLNTTRTKMPVIAQAPEALTRPAGSWERPTASLPDDWARQLKNTINQCLNAILSEAGTPYTKAAHRQKIETIVTRYQRHLTELTHTDTSYVHLLLDWAYDLLCCQKAYKWSTVRTYLSRLSHMSILENSAILDLQEWDDDTIEDIQLTLLQEIRLEASTRADTLMLLRRFFSFCTELGLLDGLHLPQANIDVPMSTLRTEIISPRDAELLWKQLTHAGVIGSTNQMYALVLALGCYGGLRIAEVANLTLADIQIEPWVEFSDDFMNDAISDIAPMDGMTACWIIVRGGKTPAARRRVPLHVLACRDVIPILDDWIQERRRQCSALPLKDIALFGPRGQPDAYSKEALGRAILPILKDGLGQRIDFHSLRHAAVSWLLLRLHAAQHHDFAESLSYRFDELFQIDRCQEVLDHFCSAGGDGILQRGNLYEVVAKWIGHRHSGTTLLHYAHTLSIIHSDILKRSR